MRCSTSCGLLLFLTRLVLGSALFLAGWHLVFGTTTLTTEELGVLDSTQAVAVVPAVLGQPALASSAPTAAVASSTAPAVDSKATDEPRSSEESSEPSAKRRPVLRLAFTLHQGGLASPEASTGIAWAVALVELIGGALLIIGLLTRLWGTLAIIVLGGLFWYQSVQSGGMFDVNPLHWAADPQSFALLYAQLGGMVLGLTLLRFGGGKLSMDQFLFGRPAIDPKSDADEV